MFRFNKLVYLAGSLAAGIALTPAWASIAIVAEFEGNIQGESRIQNYEDWITILGTSLSLSNSGNYLYPGLTSLSDISFTKHTDSSSAKLLEVLATGAHFNSGRIEYLQQTSSGYNTVLIIELGRTLVTAHSFGGFEGEDRLTESFSIHPETLTFTAVLYSSTGVQSGGSSVFWDFSTQTGSGSTTGTGSVGNAGIGGQTNTPPSISEIANVQLNEDTSATINFTVSDAQTVAGALTLSRSSTNPILLPPANITFGGSGTNRTATITPAANQFGSATVTIVVSDGALTASRQFVVNVLPVNDKPTVSSISPKVMNQGESIIVPFTIADVDTDVNALTVSANSDNLSLISAANIAFSGGGANRQMTLTPIAGQSGQANITIRAFDGFLYSDPQTFLLTVNAVSSTVPEDILLTSNTLPENSPTNTVVGVLSTIDNDPGDTHSYLILDDAGGRFKIGGANNDELLVADGSLLNYESSTFHTIMVQTTDAAENSFTKSFLINLTNVNDAPTVYIPFQNDMSPLNGPVGLLGIIIADEDAGTNPVQAEFSVDLGLLHIDDSGLLAGKVVGNHSNTILVSAAIGEINSVLNAGGLKFDSDFEGIAAITFSITVSDNGYTGPGGPQFGSANITFNYSNPWAEWVLENFTLSEIQDLDISGPSADSDQDGMPNLAEYALGLDPKDSSDANGAVVWTLTEIDGNSYQKLRFTRRSFISDPDLSVDVEVASNSFNWNSGDGYTVAESITPKDDPNFEEVVIQCVIPLNNEEPNSQFIRLRFSREPLTF